MSRATGRHGHAGRLNLEQQRTRAKELRKAVAAGGPDAVARVIRHHPGAAGLAPEAVARHRARLSDAQLVIARELGLPSWPKLKAHIDTLDRARRAIEAHAPAPDGDRATLHLRCGSDIREPLEQAGFVGAFLEFSDPFCHGPLPRGDGYRAVRTRFIAESYRMPLADVEAKLDRDYANLARATEGDARVVLWFEHDSYDQLSLARVLAEFAARAPVADLALICIDRFPLADRFRGLGQLAPEALRTLWDGRWPVTAPLLRLGAAVWDALREETPSALHAIAAGRTPEVPVMGPALIRHLQELPWTRDGLSLSQRLALATLADGPKTVSQIFRISQRETEPLPYLGDLMLWAILDDMRHAARPPFEIDPSTLALGWPQYRLVLTPAGAALLAGRLDWMTSCPRERWVGGIPIRADAPAWRWDAERAAPLRG